MADGISAGADVSASARGAGFASLPCMSSHFLLYTFGPSQNAIRPELALLEKGIAFERVDVDLFTGENKTGPLAAESPRRQVPTLVYSSGEERIVVYESIAIIRFIDDLCPDPPLMPPISQPAHRATALMRIEEFQAKLDPKNLFGSVVFAKKSRAALADRIEALGGELTRWDGYARRHPFLAGDQFTLADIAVFPLLMHFEVLGFPYARRTPSLAAYVARCKARPSVVQSGWLNRLDEFIRAREPELVLA